MSNFAECPVCNKDLQDFNGMVDYKIVTMHLDFHKLEEMALKQSAKAKEQS